MKITGSQFIVRGFGKLLLTYTGHDREPESYVIRFYFAFFFCSTAHFFHRIHVRRTDKSGEASYRDLEAYVAEAEEYFARLALTKDVTEKLVYVAADDPGVLHELGSK